MFGGVYTGTDVGVLLALGIVILGLIVTNIVAGLLSRINAWLKIFSQKWMQKALRTFRSVVFVFLLVWALYYLDPFFVIVLWTRVLQYLPSILAMLILWLLGYIILTLLFYFVNKVFLRYIDDYLEDLDISENAVKMVIGAFKWIVFLIYATLTLNVIDASLVVANVIVTGVVLAVVILGMFFVGFSFKERVANFLLMPYVRSVLLKPGQKVKFDGQQGEVVEINRHGVVLGNKKKMKILIPHTVVIKEKLELSVPREDLGHLEELVKNYVVQLPSHCGPASVSMMLNFFGYKVSQEKLAKLSGLTIRPKNERHNFKKNYGTDPPGLIKAVEKVTKKNVKGAYVKYADIQSLTEELKAWLSEGALVLLWYKRPILFPMRKSQAGHFVLAVGMEGKNILVMDSSIHTPGVFLIDSELMENAMAEFEKQRGYIVFAKRGTPAFWRIENDLVFGDVSLYEDLSKTVEKELMKVLRQTTGISSFKSPVIRLFFDSTSKVKQLWVPPSLRKR